MALSAAESLLQREGFKALSARRVAAEIGYSAGSLYTIFTNIDDLCWQLNARTLTRLLAQLDQVASEEPEACLMAYGRAYLAFAGKYPERWSLLFEHGTASNVMAPEWLNERILSLFARVESCLQRLQPEMEAKALALTARTLWSGVHGIAVLALRQKLFMDGDQPAELMLRQLICHFLKGWLAEGSQHA